MKNIFENMTKAELEEWENQQNNSTDIYKIKARVANLARKNGASLTPVGEMMINSFVHLFKALYDFSDSIQDKETKTKLIELVRKHENVPAQLIATVTPKGRKK